MAAVPPMDGTGPHGAAGSAAGWYSVSISISILPSLFHPIDFFFIIVILSNGVFLWLNPMM
jgi:hypothetical protein